MVHLVCLVIWVILVLFNSLRIILLNTCVYIASNIWTLEHVTCNTLFTVGKYGLLRAINLVDHGMFEVTNAIQFSWPGSVLILH